MTAMVSIVEIQRNHLFELRNNLRDKDRNELIAFGGVNKSVYRSFKKSIYSKAALVNDKVAAVWGVGDDILSNVGYVWLLTANVCELAGKITFVKTYRKELKKMLNLYDELVVYVDMRYKEAIKLLKLSGFSIGESMNINGVLFSKCTVRR